MRKFGLILAGAALFDLGTVVVSSHAAESISLNFSKIRIDATHTAKMCTMDGGTVISSGGKAFCQMPTATSAKAEALHVRKAGETQQQFLAAPTAGASGSPH